MCGRLNVTDDPLTQLLMDAFGITAVVETNHNLAPTQSLLVVRATPAGEYDSAVMRWWLTPSWSKTVNTKYSLFNAKSETLAEKRSFALPFRTRRCLVPVTGYYEWQTQQRQKLPFYVRSTDNQGLLLAGLWDSWSDPASGETIESCTIVTAAAHENLQPLHHRQPVFLSSEEAKAWLEPDADPDQLIPLFASHLPVPLAIDPVSTYVNNARQKDARAFTPIGDSFYVSGEQASDTLAQLLVEQTKQRRETRPFKAVNRDFFEDN